MELRDPLNAKNRFKTFILTNKDEQPEEFTPPPDPDQSLVYAAENALHGCYGLTPLGSIIECEDYVTGVLRNKDVQERWKHAEATRLAVIKSPSETWSGLARYRVGGNARAIWIADTGMNKETLLHEVSHALVSPREPAHGRIWRGHHILLVGTIMGETEARRLTMAYLTAGLLSGPDDRLGSKLQQEMLKDMAKEKGFHAARAALQTIAEQA